MANLPVSSLLRQGDSFSAEDGIPSRKRKSKDEYRKQKDLEEQRKAGTAPAMVDTETGRDINPHIPEFIEKAPWYIPHSGPTLKHQRPQPDRQKEYNLISEWYPKGTSDRIALKYREGACENCGGMGHRKKDCFEKPRVVGAKWSNTNIAPDDHTLPKLSLDWDAKRDRWNGYNADDYKFVVQEYEKMDETRKLIRAEQLKGTEEEKNLEQDEDIYAEDATAPGQSVDMDSRTRITDMPGKEQEAAQYAGENFLRYTGEVTEANESQLFAWQSRCKGLDIHSLAEPTRLELLKKEFQQQKEQNKSCVKNELLEKYGGEEHLSAPPKELLLAQSENYVEYNRKGKVIKGDEGPAVKSKYQEDALINNHTSVWGSYWRDGRWGYRCCHQFLFNSYCLGKQGILVEQTNNKRDIDADGSSDYELTEEMKFNSHF
uniref:Pre-mRNA-splicing factor SLU7 n=1 Tax=Meloidogyne javanica TaxID=6303 RepID=A0A915MVC0_MELJA